MKLMYICVSLICAVVVLHGGRVVLVQRRCNKILAVVDFSRHASFEVNVQSFSLRVSANQLLAEG